MPREEFEREVEKELTGRETEPYELMYFKLYQSQIPVVDRAIETASLMLGSDKSRGYCLEMICADFLAGANLENDNPGVLLQSALRFFQFFPGEERKVFLDSVTEKAGMTWVRSKQPRLRLDPERSEQLRNQVLPRDGGRCQFYGTRSHLEVHPNGFAASPARTPSRT